MYLNNNGEYIQIGNINKSNIDIQKIYDIFSIKNNPKGWKSLKSMPTARYGLVSHVYNGKIYCIGGANTAVTGIVEIYDIANNTWSTGASMLTARKQFTSQLYNGKIYCIGGNNVNTYTNIVEIYDIANNIWTTGASMPTNRYDLASALYNNKIYCIGGSNFNVVKTVEIYNILTNTWTTGTAMPTATTDFGCAIYNSKIYCIGGFTSGWANIVYIYDINNNTWATGTAMPIYKMTFGCIIINNNIYCIGGGSRNASTGNSEYTTTVNVYNTLTNSWTTETSLPVVMSDFGYTCNIDNKIYCIGGNAGSTTGSVYVFNFQYYSYVTPTNYINNKINKIINNQPGTKIFSNDLTYKAINPSYINMNNAEINNYLLELTGGV